MKDKTVRYYVQKEAYGKSIIEVVEMTSVRDGAKFYTTYQVSFGEGSNFDNGDWADILCGLMNDGLRYRGEYKSEGC